MLRGTAACALTGIPELHADAFQEVADATQTVIASRAVGVYATGLILEGYASKGFHNKAKSCNWGPMAGFVLDDPRFTKVGGSTEGQAEQKAALLHAIEDDAIEVPLFISDARRQWLMQQRLVQLVDRDNDAYLLRAVSPWGLKLDFRLQPERPEGAHEKMWAVLYRSADRQSARDAAATSGAWTPVMAMRDPLCVIPASDYRAATTGDYDLFAVWALQADYSPDGADKRMVGHAALEAAIRARQANTGEDAHLGNMTQRLRSLRDKLNTAFLRRGYTGGNMVHHSDEGGRPFVKDIDLPIFAVVPGGKEAYALRSVPDLRQFITKVLNDQSKYATVVSPGWVTQLVFGDNVTAAKALKADLLAFDKRRLKQKPSAPLMAELVAFDRSRLKPVHKG
ncbi:MAG: anthrax toxin-like adenylyl cyclase domain-containing protein [Rubrivivax sp.]|jgi:hypothetical protein